MSSSNYEIQLTVNFERHQLLEAGELLEKSEPVGKLFGRFRTVEGSSKFVLTGT